MRLQTVDVLLAGLLPIVGMTSGCGGTSGKQLGMTVIYEVDADGGSTDAQPSAPDMQRLLAAMDRRLNPGWAKRGQVRRSEDGRIEVSIFRADPKEMQQIADLLPKPGFLEFRILANALDHQAIIDRAKAESNIARLHDDGGQLLAWWLPVEENAAKWIRNQIDILHIISRTVAKGEQEDLEVLVIKDEFDVTGSFISQAAIGIDKKLGAPCVELTFDSVGAQRFRALSESNRPNLATGFQRTLGLIFDGELCSIQRITDEISEDVQISGPFLSHQVVEELAFLLDMGSLPRAIRKVEQQFVEMEKEPSP